MVYKIKNIDEAFISDDSVRTNYKKYYNWFNNQDFSNLTKKKSEAFKFFKDTDFSDEVVNPSELKSFPDKPLDPETPPKKGFTAGSSSSTNSSLSSAKAGLKQNKIVNKKIINLLFIFIR